MKINLPVTGRRIELSSDSNILSTTTEKGVITSVNSEFIKISGFSEDELIGKPHNIVRHPDMPQAAFASLWYAMKSGRSWMGLVKNRCKNGDHYWVSAYATPITKDGQTVEFQSVRTQPSPRAVEAAEKLYKQLAKNWNPRAIRRPILGLFGTQMVHSCVITGILIGLACPLWEVPLATALSCGAIGLALRSASVWWTLRPWRSLVSDARKIVDNPISQWVYTGSRSEIGEVSFALRMQTAECGAIIGRMGEAARQLVAQATQMQDAVLRSDQGALKQQSEIAQITSAIDQLARSIEAVSVASTHSAEAARQGGQATILGEDQVTETANAIGVLEKQIQQAADHLSGLQSHSSRITSVIEVISGIADQTNLLALNAVIEAARAGDAGRGFTVVADEVRGLAKRTQDSTIQIRSILNVLQEQIEDAALFIKDCQRQAQSSAAQAERAKQAMADAHVRVEAISSRCGEIAQTVQDKLVALGVITKSMEAIHQGNQDTVAFSAESRVAAEKFASQAEQMSSLAGQFWDRRIAD